MAGRVGGTVYRGLCAGWQIIRLAQVRFEKDGYVFRVQSMRRRRLSIAAARNCARTTGRR